MAAVQSRKYPQCDLMCWAVPLQCHRKDSMERHRLWMPGYSMWKRAFTYQPRALQQELCVHMLGSFARLWTCSPNPPHSPSCFWKQNLRGTKGTCSRPFLLGVIAVFKNDSVLHLTRYLGNCWVEVKLWEYKKNFHCNIHRFLHRLSKRSRRPHQV